MGIEILSDLIRPCDQPWINSYTRLLLRKKNRNYQLFKRDSCKLTNAISKDRSEEVVTCLSDKKNKNHINSTVQLQMNPVKEIEGPN